MTTGKIVVIGILSVLTVGIFIGGYFVIKNVSKNKKVSDAKKLDDAIAKALASKSAADIKTADDLAKSLGSNTNATKAINYSTANASVITWIAKSDFPITIGNFSTLESETDNPVKRLQVALGFSDANIDGYYGNDTAAAVKAAGLTPPITDAMVKSLENGGDTTPTTAIPDTKVVPIGTTALAIKAGVTYFKVKIRAGYTLTDVNNATADKLYLMLEPDFAHSRKTSKYIGDPMGRVLSNYVDSMGTRFYLTLWTATADIYNAYGYVQSAFCYY